jgi:hypothetical protein
VENPCGGGLAMSSNKKIELRPDDRDKPSIPEITPPEKKPLSRVQAYLIELEVCFGLLRKVLLEMKEVAFVIVMILFFIWSAVQLFKGIH